MNNQRVVQYIEAGELSDRVSSFIAGDNESSSESESDSDSDSDSENAAGGAKPKPAAPEPLPDTHKDFIHDEEAWKNRDQSEEATVRRLSAAVDRKFASKRQQRNEEEFFFHDDLYDFPPDPENWREIDICEYWADAPFGSAKVGWDPVTADEEDWALIEEEKAEGNNPPCHPFYVPYRKCFPVIPSNHHDIKNAKAVIEELDRIEEFLTWGSYIFVDNSTYEGTIWDDLAHGRGVYVGENGLVRYEGEWLKNEMEGHGVVEVEIPGVEPVPGSELEAKMREEGRIIKRDFMTPEDKRWLEMDIEDSYRLAGGERVIPFYEREEWIEAFGQKPEKGRYRYAGQWKHGRMHGCGVYEFNEQILYGRFYFGEHLDDTTGCDEDVSALHAGIAEVAAAKARMFINKPDGMIREDRGPYGDPQHPYFYEEEDVWMAPGFVNQFYEVPDYWKVYVQEVDQEREMWLNSFYKAPLRIPMPAELEYWWSQADPDEFIVINKEPEPDPEDPSKLVYTEDPLIVHTPTGRVINCVDDEEHGVRLFWQPDLKDGEELDLNKVEFLPLGFDEFYGRTEEGAKKPDKLTSMVTSLGTKLNALFERLDNWVEEKKKESEIKRKLLEQELEFAEAEMSLEEALEDMEDELKMQQKEEEKRSATEKDSDQVSAEGGEDEAESDDEDEDETPLPPSFGTVAQDETKKSDDKSGKSPFSSVTLSLASCPPISMIPPKLQESFMAWRRGRTPITDLSMKTEKMNIEHHAQLVGSVKYPLLRRRQRVIRAVVKPKRRGHGRSSSGYRQLNSLARALSCQEAYKTSSKLRPAREICSGACDLYNLSISSLNVPIAEIIVPWLSLQCRQNSADQG